MSGLAMNLRVVRALGMRSIRQTFRRPQLMAPIVVFPTILLAIQTGEHGPLHQMVAGIDMALWDLQARRAGLPLWKLLGGEAARPVAVYASGLNPTEPEALALHKRDEGYRAFKLKVGFGAERDLANLRAMRDALLASARFQRFAAAFPLTRPIARHRAADLEHDLLIAVVVEIGEGDAMSLVEFARPR